MYYARMAFTFAHAVVTQARPEDLWRLYADPATWPSWDPDAEYVTLDGPFATGSRGTMKFTGQDPLAYVLEDVDEHRAFTDVTSVPGATIRFGHRIEPTDEGTRFTHELRIEADEPFAAELGAMISADIPDSMLRLARLAEEAA
jgi:polyketide cyclase/dehydrase/lipid transport protein